MKDFLAEIKADLERVKMYIVDGDLRAAELDAGAALAKLEARLQSIEGA